MTKMTRFQLLKCVEITERLIDWEICAPFVDLIDPKEDGAPNYYEIIKNPMSLAGVLGNLVNNKYDSIDNWAQDVNTIWENAVTYNGVNTVFAQMALEASLWFNKKVKKIPSSREEEWTAKMQSITQKLMAIIMNAPELFKPKIDAFKTEEEED